MQAPYLKFIAVVEQHPEGPVPNRRLNARPLPRHPRLKLHGRLVQQGKFHPQNVIHLDNVAGRGIYYDSAHAYVGCDHRKRPRARQSRVFRLPLYQHGIAGIRPAFRAGFFPRWPGFISHTGTFYHPFFRPPAAGFPVALPVFQEALYNAAMTGQERISRILQRQPVDRVGLFEHFWGDTIPKWIGQGHLKPDVPVATQLGFDMDIYWTFNYVANLDWKDVIVAEDADTVTAQDGNGAILRRHKRDVTTPEHVDFTVKDRAGWEEHVKPFLKPERRRIDFENYNRIKKECADAGRFFCWSGINVFEQMHPVCGHEYMLEGMVTDPDWIKDMVATYARLNIDLMETLFAEAGRPDGIWYYEDMGFKNTPFISPAMYREIIQPAHIKTIGYAHSRGLPVIMHSCGMVEKLLPGMVEAGIDCLQVIEVKAGMDLLRIYREYGDRLSLMGGIDVRVLYTNDLAKVDAELKAKIPIVKGHNGYVVHSDHSIPHTVDYSTYRHFVSRALELGKY